LNASGETPADRPLSPQPIRFHPAVEDFQIVRSTASASWKDTGWNKQRNIIKAS
jgi:hypothetical protein